MLRLLLLGVSAFDVMLGIIIFLFPGAVLKIFSLPSAGEMVWFPLVGLFLSGLATKRILGLLVTPGYALNLPISAGVQITLAIYLWLVILNRMDFGTILTIVVIGEAVIGLCGLYYYSRLRAS